MHIEVEVTSAQTTNRPKKRSGTFMKRRQQAKTGTNNFVEITMYIVRETLHQFTLVNGKVIRKNDTRKFLDPPEGTFGTPSKLEKVRVFVHRNNAGTRVRVRAGERKWATAMFPAPGRLTAILPADERTMDAIRDRREAAYRRANTSRQTYISRMQEWTDT